MASDIDYEEMSSKKDQFVIYDVRTTEEIQGTGHIPGAHCLPFKEMEDALKLDEKTFLDKYGFEKPKKEQMSVTHCHGGGRARKAGNLLAENGYAVRIYAGSFSDWKNKGGEVVPGIPHK